MKRTELDILVTDFVSEILIKTFKNESDLTFLKTQFADKIENEMNRDLFAGLEPVYINVQASEMVYYEDDIGVDKDTLSTILLEYASQNNMEPKELFEKVKVDKILLRDIIRDNDYFYDFIYENMQYDVVESEDFQIDDVYVSLESDLEEEEKIEEKIKPKLQFDYCVSTGTLLKQYLEAYGLNYVDIVKLTGFDLPYVLDVLNDEVSISVAFAIALEKVFENVKADFWLDCEKNYTRFLNEKGVLNK